MADLKDAPTEGRVDLKDAPTEGRVDLKDAPTEGRVDLKDAPTEGRDEEEPWDFSGIPTINLGDMAVELAFDPRDHTTDYSYKLEKKTDDLLASGEDSRETFLRKKLDELEARKSRLTYPSRKPAVRERINKIRKAIDAEMAATSKELLTYDLMGS
jgi:hypothetical protein